MQFVPLSPLRSGSATLRLSLKLFPLSNLRAHRVSQSHVPQVLRGETFYATHRASIFSSKTTFLMNLCFSARKILPRMGKLARELVEKFNF